mmetsp:Transcript_12702/g.20763  ORF Transcript_12702/g.20763 Transcript_12702/m.20763 type:complete len:366 (-) Transcript_12702:614-1711(-)
MPHRFLILAREALWLLVSLSFICKAYSFDDVCDLKDKPFTTPYVYNGCKVPRVSKVNISISLSTNTTAKILDDLKLRVCVRDVCTLTAGRNTTSVNIKMQPLPDDSWLVDPEVSITVYAGSNVSVSGSVSLDWVTLYARGGTCGRVDCGTCGLIGAEGDTCACVRDCIRVSTARVPYYVYFLVPVGVIIFVVFISFIRIKYVQFRRMIKVEIFDAIPPPKFLREPDFEVPLIVQDPSGAAYIAYTIHSEDETPWLKAKPEESDSATVKMSQVGGIICAEIVNESKSFLNGHVVQLQPYIQTTDLFIASLENAPRFDTDDVTSQPLNRTESSSVLVTSNLFLDGSSHPLAEDMFHLPGTPTATYVV